MVGAVLAAIYLVVATFITQDEVRHSGGGWINLRGIGTNIMTAPSQVIVVPILRAFGVPPVNYADLKVWDYGQLVLHVVVSTVIVYFLGAGLQWLFRYAVARS